MTYFRHLTETKLAEIAQSPYEVHINRAGCTEILRFHTRRGAENEVSYQERQGRQAVLIPRDENSVV